MGFKIADRVKEKSNTVGTGDIALNGPIKAFQSFDSVLSSGDTTFYVVEGVDYWEVGLGTYNSHSLNRTSIFSSSNSGNVVSLGGENTVSLTYPSERAVYLDEILNANVGSGVVFSNDSSVLNTSNGFLYWDNNKLAYENDNIYVSGIATYASGQAILNQQSIIDQSNDIAYVSGLAVNAEETLDINYVSGIAVYASGQVLSYRKYQNSFNDIVMGIDDDIVFVDSTSSLVNVYIPIASGNGGKELMIKRVAGDNDVVIIASGIEKIDGESTYIMHHLYQCSTLVSNNLNWYIT